MKIFIKSIIVTGLTFFFITVKPSLAVSVTVSATVDTVLVLQGYTSPNSLVVFLENSTAKGTTVSDSNGVFEKEFNSQDPGVHIISMYAIDPTNTNTQTVSIEILAIQNQTITISDLYLPPTIKISAVEYSDNQNISVFGYSLPDSLIKIEFSGTVSKIDYTRSEPNGYYSNLTPASSLGIGSYQVAASLPDFSSNTNTESESLSFSITTSTAPTPTTTSSSSSTSSSTSNPTPTPQITSLSPTPIPCPYLYVNLCFFDKEKKGFIGIGNLSFIDFLIEFVKNYEKPLRLAVDLNNDGLINSPDLSIFFYHVKIGKNPVIGFEFDKNQEKPTVLGLASQSLDYPYQIVNNKTMDFITNPSIRLLFNLIMMEIVVGIPFFIAFLVLMIIFNRHGQRQ